MQDLNSHPFQQDWQKKAGQINCPAPLPEDPADARLTKLLVPAPHVVPEKKAKKKAVGTQKSSRRLVVSDSSPDSPKAPSALKTRRRKKKPLPLQRGEERKGRSPQLGRPEDPRRGEPSCRTTPPMPKTAGRNGHPGSSPWQNRKYLDIRITYGAPLLFDIL